MKDKKWKIEKVVGDKRVYARTTRSRVIVRVEKDGDTTKCITWTIGKRFPRGKIGEMFNIDFAIDDALRVTKDEDIVKDEGVVI